jgi:hypothetical protein
MPVSQKKIFGNPPVQNWKTKGTGSSVDQFWSVRNQFNLIFL